MEVSEMVGGGGRTVNENFFANLFPKKRKSLKKIQNLEMYQKLELFRIKENCVSGIESIKCTTVH